MVADAEKYKAEDEAQKTRIESKNGLESYAFNMKTTLDDEKVKDKISEEDRKTLMSKCEEVIEWIDANQAAEKDEYDEKKKELEEVCNPVISKMYQAAGGMPGGADSSASGGASAGASSGPTVEEVD